MGKIIAFHLLFVFCFCSPQKTGTQNQAPTASEFDNYISLIGKVFKDGSQDFYPMIMNYSVDLLCDPDLFATPRRKYHPFYGENKGESKSPWGSDAAKTHAMIQQHFYNIKKMGFNGIRLTGFTATDHFDGEFKTWNNLDVSNSVLGNKNIDTAIIPLLKKILKLAENAGLRVILLISGVENQIDNQHNYYTKIAEALSNEKTLFAYDLYNEPVYFDRGRYTKLETYHFIKNYNDIIKSVAPNHLTTIGLTHYKIVYEWDPELMEVDFLSFHAYPYWSKDLSLLERFESKLYWISNNISKPWIVGETGLNTVVECDPLNLAVGTEEHQLQFMKYSLEKFRSAGASGYSWWNYQDSRKNPSENCPNWDRYGLVSSKKEGAFEDGYIGKLKHNIEDLPFSLFLANSPYRGMLDTIQMPPEEHYYNIDYLPTHKNAVGKIIDISGKPIEDAIITLQNTISNTQYSTFSRPDGTFDLKTGWTNIFNHLDFILRVTAVKKNTVEIALEKVYSGHDNKFIDIVLLDFELEK